MVTFNRCFVFLMNLWVVVKEAMRIRCTLYTCQNGYIKKSALQAYHPDNDPNLSGLSLRHVSHLGKSGILFLKYYLKPQIFNSVHVPMAWGQNISRHSAHPVNLCIFKARQIAVMFISANELMLGFTYTCAIITGYS